MTKKLAAWILLTCFLVTSAAPPAHAASPSLSRVLRGMKSQARFTRFNVRPVSVRDADARLARVAKEKAKQTGGMIFETFLFITTLAVIDVTAREIKRQGLTAVSPKRMGEITLGAAREVVDMPEIYAGLVGASTTIAAAKAPSTAIQLIFKTPKIKSAFVPVLARAATATIAFVGWELGSQLWTESSLLLSNEDYEIAKSFLGLGSGVAKTTIAAGTVGDRERARVAKLMVQNMIRILFLNPDLRSEWMKNTWRLHVMTGDFAALLGAMIMAGEVGSRYGRLRGFFAGVAFGALTLAIPHGPKDAVTNAFQDVRTRVLRGRLDENTQYLATRAGASFKTILANRHSFRESLSTIAWEKMHRALARKDVRLPSIELREFSNVYATERAHLESLARTAAGRAHAGLLAREIEHVSIVGEFAAMLADEGASALAEDFDFRQIADATNARGFSEANVIAQMRAATAE